MPDGDVVPHPKPGDGRELVERHWTLRAIVGSLSGGMMMALNFSFDTLFCHCYSGGYQRGNAYPADGGCPPFDFCT